MTTFMFNHKRKIKFEKYEFVIQKIKKEQKKKKKKKSDKTDEEIEEDLKRIKQEYKALEVSGFMDINHGYHTKEVLTAITKQFIS